MIFAGALRERCVVDLGAARGMVYMCEGRHARYSEDGFVTFDCFGIPRSDHYSVRCKNTIQ